MPKRVIKTRAVLEQKRRKATKNGDFERDPTVDAASEESTYVVKDAQAVVVESVFKGKHPQLKELLTESGWKSALSEEFDKAYFSKLQQYLETEWDDPQCTVYPPVRFIFEAFHQTPFDNVRVVLLGQDPYHGRNQATGLSFSVPKEEKIPGSLRNIFKEVNNDVGCDTGQHGDLSNWAKQGVLLLNTVLTVRAAKANSHKKKGWENLTNRVISILNEQKSHLVFFLWGKHAQMIGAGLDREKHLVLECPHPSGLSAYKGFFGCKHFSKCNAYLESHDLKPIDWNVSSHDLESA